MCVCVHKMVKVDLCKEVKALLLNTTLAFHCDLYIYTNYMAQKSITIVLTVNTTSYFFSPFASLLRPNILQMGPRWATAPSTSNTGWTGVSWQWGWSTSCPPVCPLSTYTTTQTLPHCRWAPTLLSGQLPGLGSATSSSFRCWKPSYNCYCKHIGWWWRWLSVKILSVWRWLVAPYGISGIVLVLMFH